MFFRARAVRAFFCVYAPAGAKLGHGVSGLACRVLGFSPPGANCRIWAKRFWRSISLVVAARLSLRKRRETGFPHKNVACKGVFGRSPSKLMRACLVHEQDVLVGALIEKMPQHIATGRFTMQAYVSCCHLY